MATDNDNCWFCCVRSADEEVAVSVKLYGNVRSEPLSFGNTRVTWDTEVVRVPCCRHCDVQAQKKINILYAGAGIGVLLAFVGFVCLKCVIGLPVVLSILAGAFALGAAAIVTAVASRAVVRNDLRSARNPVMHPDVQLKLAAGWKLGHEPPEAVRLGD